MSLSGSDSRNHSLLPDDQTSTTSPYVASTRRNTLARHNTCLSLNTYPARSSTMRNRSTSPEQLYSLQTHNQTLAHDRGTNQNNARDQKNSVTSNQSNNLWPDEATIETVNHSNIHLNSLSAPSESSRSFHTKSNKPAWIDLQSVDGNHLGFDMLVPPSSDITCGSEVILAINIKGKILGGAYFDGYACKLYVMQDMSDCDILDTIQRIKDQIHPTLILTSSRVDEYVNEALKWNEDNSENKLETRPNGEFSYHLARTKLVSIVMRFKQSDTNAFTSGTYDPPAPLNIASNTDDIAQRGALIQLSNLVDLESSESIGCSGAIVNFLSRHGFAHHLRDGRSTAAISISSFTLGSFMYVNRNTLNALKVFEDESHPSMHSSIRGRKEGLSLFGLLNQTKTSQGRYLLKQWLLRPSLSMETIRMRHQSVECFMRTENQTTVNQLADSLTHIKNIPKVLQAMSRKARINDWQFVLQIKQHFLTEDLMTIGSHINDVLDFDESIIEGRCVVKRNVDEDLDSMRQTYNGLDSFLSEIAKDISVTIPSNFASVINFCTESTVYYKNAAMRELDEHLGDIHGLIVDREIDILQVLQERIIESSELLILCSNLCAQLDVLISFAQVARLRNYRRPTLVEGTILQIVNGRHPLQELVVDSFVRNNTCVGGTEKYFSALNEKTDGETSSYSLKTDNPQLENRVMVLTGPNSSGKSVYLKQVALITFMAQVGSFVPADSAIIGITDKILTRLQTRETVSSNLSAFMADMLQVEMTMRIATARSLVILDEFGKGTTSTDGAGLFCGVIEYFAQLKEEERPRVLATTHFHELFANNLMNMGLPISFYTMEVIGRPNCMETVFLFRVVQGNSPVSLGPLCAAMANMPSHIVQRATHLSELFRRYEPMIPQLTPREKELCVKYERLTWLLLHMDLEDSHAMDFWDGGKEIEIVTTSNSDVELSVKHKKHSGDSLGKRKHEDRTTSHIDTDFNEHTKSLRTLFQEFLELVAEIDAKEHE
ncbi:MutS protein msh5 [Linnemannia zychae]|nr:MutS protein msh5 [Linnemannia zychae]